MLQLAGFSEIQEVGAGGQAKVFSATQDAFQRKAAIKVLHPELAEDQDFASRFLREAQIVAGLSHPNIVQVYDSGQRDGHLYMAMEYLGNGDLTQAIEKGMDVDRVLDVTSQIAMALHFLHQKGFVHRDVKPDNVLFREDGTAVLTDFGIARPQNAAHQLTMVGQVLGTPKYMSPEQLQDKAVDGRSDIYSLGIMFYQMLTRQAPYEDKDFTALAMKHIQAPIPKLPAQFAKFQKFFERMVAKEPEKRFQNALEIVRVIKQARSGKIENVESGAAAELKRSVTGVNAAAKPAAAKPAGITTAQKANVKIPRELMVELQDMDPLLDLKWKDRVTAIYNKMSEEQRVYVFEHYLEPKGVQMDAEGNEFVFYGRPSVQDVASKLVTAALQAVAGKLEQAEKMLRTTSDIIEFANLIEGGVSAIDSFDSMENMKAQKEKGALKAAFLDDLVLIVRGAKLDVPENRQLLTEESIKAYIIYVYIRHEMLGYRFKTLPVAALESSPNAYLKEVVAPEARLRQCDIIKTEKYYFLVGPVKNSEQNPYSVRRFLQEESTWKGKHVYYNVAIIPMAIFGHAKYEEHIKWVLSRIVTLERQLSNGIISLVRDIETAYSEKLNPMLFKPIQSDGSDMDKLINDRLMDFEKSLSMMVLGKIPKGIKELAQSADDFEFLYFSLRRLLIEIACDIRDFSAQSTTMFSDRAAQLDLRMMSYLKLLDKRKYHLFVKTGSDEVETALDTALPIEEFNNTLSEFEPKIEALKVKYKEVIRKKQEPKSAFRLFIDKLTKAEEKRIKPEDVQNEMDAAKHKCLIELIKIRKRYPMITVYLEFEDLIAVDEAIRHFALPSGTLGLARLPILIRLPEDRTMVDISKIKDALQADIFKPKAA